MSNPTWFDRKFDFSFDTGEYAAIYERLNAAPDMLRHVVEGAPEDMLTHKPEGKWSVKEHVGHLSVLESLWRTRFGDISNQKPVLTPTDLENRATTEALFNEFTIRVLLDRFAAERLATLSLLDSIDARDNSKTSQHPRLQQPMRIIDKAYFVAEHDDHHIAAIRGIIGR